MAAPRRGGRLPGWYHDPGDPDRLRYWSGSGWTARRRYRPTWESSSAEWVVAEPALGQAVAHARQGGDDDPPDGFAGPVLEGPVRPAELPAIAAAVGSTTERSRPPQGPAGPRTGRRPAAVAGRPGLGTGPYSQPRPWRASRRPVRLVGTVAVVAVIVMIITVGIIPPSARSEWALSDRSYVGHANNVCSSALPAAPRASTPAMTPAPAAGSPSGASAPAATGSPSSPPVSAAAGPTTLVATANAVDALADRLGSMPVDTTDRAHVRLWLDSWHSWAYDQRKVARDLVAGSRSALSDATQAETMARAEQDAADHFALINGLVACTLSSTSAATSSPVPVG
jgi:hypothetical protein